MSTSKEITEHKETTRVTAATVEKSKVISGKNGEVIVLVPQPSDDPDDPLNWPTRKKITVFACVCFAAFAANMAPGVNLLTFIEQVPVYRTTVPRMLDAVAASLAGSVIGPFLIIPFCSVMGRSSVIFWSLVFTFITQVWAAEMTGSDDYISFVMSRLFCGIWGGIPAILGAGYGIDMFFLHQRGKAFAVFEVLVTFAVVGGATLGGFIAQTQPWTYVFWWTLGPIGAATILTFLFVEDTTFNRAFPESNRPPLPRGWLANRLATFFLGMKTQPSGKKAAFIRSAIVPIQITFAPISLLTGAYTFIALGVPIMQQSTLATYLAPPPFVGGYGFSSRQIAAFTFTAWIGIISAQMVGFFFNDKIPLWIARRRGGTWHTEYRLANTVLPSVIIPTGLGIYGAGLQYHLHFMVLALGAFLIWFGALLAVPVCYNYIIECFLHNPVEASVSLNAYRLSFGVMAVFIITQWQAATGIGWMWGTAAFVMLFVDLIAVGIILKGHMVRRWSAQLFTSIAATEDGAQITLRTEDVLE